MLLTYPGTKSEFPEGRGIHSLLEASVSHAYLEVV